MIKENTPLLETERLLLRKFTQKDLEAVFLIYGDKEVNRFLPWFPVNSLEEAKAYLQNNILSAYTKEAAYYYAITLEGTPIGYLTINSIGKSNDLGYGLRKEFWRKGIVTEACLAVVDRLRKTDFPYLTATHDIKNPYSGEVMKKIGMTYRYTYEELVQPKNENVTFQMYQLNLDGVEERVYNEYRLPRS